MFSEVEELVGWFVRQLFVYYYWYDLTGWRMRNGNDDPLVYRYTVR